ncbi:MAG: T9SS type A sorting domain-containing protein [Ignavibacteriales bacterium]|nr:T9SS type A sorting domain-containing protein [Ignavibacteriales bacterium]
MYIEEFYKHNNLLFTLVQQNNGNYCVGIYDISDIKNPVELGRKEKNTYEGNKFYENCILYEKDSILTEGFYAIKSNPDVDIIDHYFWKPNLVIEIDDRFFYFRNYDQDIKVLKMKNQLNFELIKTFQLTTQSSEISGIAAVDEVIYISTRYAGVYSGLILIDASDLNNLKEVQSPVTDQDLTGLVSGNKRILVGKNFGEVMLFDCSDPRKPKFVTTNYYPHNRLRGFWQDKNFFLYGYQKNISIYDSSINLIKKISTSGDVYSAHLNPTHLFIGTTIGIEICNINNLNNPAIESIYGANIGHPINFIKEGNYIYTTNMGDGLKIIDVSDSSVPKIIGELDLNGCTRNIVISGNYAYLADYIKGLEIIDISNPNKPELISTLNIPLASDLDIRKDKIFLINDKNEVFVIDITNKYQPEMEYSKSIQPFYFQYFGEYKKIKITGDNIWVKFDNSPLYAFQYSNKNFTEIFKYDYVVSNEPNELLCLDSLLFLVQINGTQIFEPYNLQFISEISPLWFANIKSVSLDIAKKILYALISYDFGSRILKYDFTNPAEPKLIEGGIILDFPPEHILFNDDLLFVLTRDGITIYLPDKISGILRDEEKTSKITFQLSQNFPNPFNPTTKIKFQIANFEFVSLKVYDILGNEVATLVNEEIPLSGTTGNYEVEFDGSNLSSGIYFYVLNYDDLRISKKMCILK